MTVRTWVTISVLVLVALAVAVAVRVASPIRPPGLIATAAGQRLDGSPLAACWPQRSGKPRCERHNAEDVIAVAVPGSGAIRVIAAYPIQPRAGTLRIARRGQTQPEVAAAWTDKLPYDLAPGRYTLRAEARYADKNAYVRWEFGFVVRA